MSVTASPQLVHSALAACRVALASLTIPGEIYEESREAAVRIVQNYKSEGGSLKHWTQIMTGLQNPLLPHKSIDNLVDFESVVSAVTSEDLRLLAKCLKLDDGDSMTECVGTTKLPNSEPSLINRSASSP